MRAAAIIGARLTVIAALTGAIAMIAGILVARANENLNKLPPMDKRSAAEQACSLEYITDDHPTDEEMIAYRDCVAMLTPGGTASAQELGGFPPQLQGLWCVSLGESTPTVIILNPNDTCKQDGGVVLISFSQHVGPNPGGYDCGLDTIVQIEGAKEIEVNGEHGEASPLYHVTLHCFPGGQRGWTDFTIRRNSFYDGSEELVVKPSPQG
jgi:hypothetical protein